MLLHWMIGFEISLICILMMNIPSLATPDLLSEPQFCALYGTEQFTCNCHSCNCQSCFSCGCSSSLLSCNTPLCGNECWCSPLCYCCHDANCQYACNCETCCDTCSRDICMDMRTYHVVSLFPSTGPIAESGGTPLILHVANLSNSHQIRCRFTEALFEIPLVGEVTSMAESNSRVTTLLSSIAIDVIATFVESDVTVRCVSPPWPNSGHMAGQTVVHVEVSLDNGLHWTTNRIPFQYYQCPSGSNNNSCSSRGVCNADSTCTCTSDYAGSACELTCPGLPGAACNDHASGSSTNLCNHDGSCSCLEGYWDVSCSQTCPGSSVAANGSLLQTCSGHGLCNSVTGVCDCERGFVGANCSYAGSCDSEGKCVCPIGRYGMNCEFECAGNSHTVVGSDYHNTSCSDNGICSSEGVCLCTNGFYGDDCALSCAPAPSIPCSLHGQCNRNGTCLCDLGWFDTVCSQACPGGSGTKSCSGHGQCNVNGLCACDGTHVSPSCDIPCPMSADEQVCSAHGQCTMSELKTAACQCDAGYFGVACSSICPGGFPGNVATTACSGHGRCSETGQCVCDFGSWGAECNQTCPGSLVKPCSLNGVCSTITGQCRCLPGFWGEACQEACPGDLFSPCSLNGICNQQTGGCHCNPGFNGTACADAVCLFDCYQHGRCVGGACLCSDYSQWSGMFCSEPVGQGNNDPSESSAALADIYGLVQLRSSAYSIGEGSRTICIEIYRYSLTSGCILNGTVRAQVNSSGITASPGIDFILSASDYVWAPNDCSIKNISVLILDDTLQEDAEQFVITIARIDGLAQFGPNRRSIITIQANNAGGTFMQTDAMEVVCRLTIDYAELPESSVARHNFLEGFRMELSAFLDIPSARIAFVLLRDGAQNISPGSFLTFNILAVSIPTSASASNVAAEFVQMLSRGIFARGNFTKFIDIATMPHVSKIHTAVTTAPSASALSFFGWYVTSVCIGGLLLVLACGLYWKRKSVSEYILWKLGEFRFRSLNEDRGVVDDASNPAVTMYAFTSHSADNDDVDSAHEALEEFDRKELGMGLSNINGLSGSAYSIGSSDENEFDGGLDSFDEGIRKLGFDRNQFHAT